MYELLELKFSIKIFIWLENLADLKSFRNTKETELVIIMNFMFEKD